MKKGMVNKFLISQINEFSWKLLTSDFRQNKYTQPTKLTVEPNNSLK